MKQNYDLILFDLDGTITDSKEGITKSVQYALNKYGIIIDNPDKLLPFVGPPLHKSFEIFYGFDEKKSFEAVDFFREYFKEKGIFENEVYSGMKELLINLKKEGKTVALATSKPQLFAEQILKHFDLHHLFDYIKGSNLDGSMTDKTEIIADVLTNLKHFEKSKTVMIGDRDYDIIGARNNNIDSIAAGYGFGTEEEIEKIAPTFVAENIKQLKELLVN